MKLEGTGCRGPSEMPGLVLKLICLLCNMQGTKSHFRAAAVRNTIPGMATAVFSRWGGGVSSEKLATRDDRMGCRHVPVPGQPS
jgi:hypothetical protein